MSKQFKPGDLALTRIDRGSVPAWSTVEIREFIGEGQPAHAVGGDILLAPEDTCLCSSANEQEGLVPYRPRELMPLRGDFQPEREQSREVPA